MSEEWSGTALHQTTMVSLQDLSAPLTKIGMHCLLNRYSLLTIMVRLTYYDGTPYLLLWYAFLSNIDTLSIFVAVVVDVIYLLFFNINI